MYGFHALVERWGTLVSGLVLFALPLARGYFAGPLGWIDMVVGGVGIAALLLALEDFLRRRALARRIGKQDAYRGGKCPHCGERVYA
jgi:hypothetical protein